MRTGPFRSVPAARLGAGGFGARWRMLLVLGLMAVTVGVLAWTAGQAYADSEAETTLNVCVAPNGAMRAAATCRPNESMVSLLTEAAADEFEQRFEALEGELSAANQRIDDLETISEDLEGELADANERIDDLESRIEALEGEPADDERIEALEADLAAAVSRVAELERTLASVERGPDAEGRDTLRFVGMNLQVVNGTGTTDGDPNGLGNIIIGYDTANPFTASDKSGSHYLVVGDQHSYTRHAGIVAGLRNTASGRWASVTGGAGNIASGELASVSGGSSNTASGNASSVAGGTSNTANGYLSAVSAGHLNTASGIHASVSGGRSNTASGEQSSILGGLNKTVTSRNACHPSCE